MSCSRSRGWSVGGMPVNKSPALESAADHMQVSAAPALASVPVTGAQAVVQGVFVDAHGKKLSEKDVEAMISMMEGSLQSHSGFMSGIAEKKYSGQQDIVQNLTTLSDAYSEKQSSVRGRYLEMMRSKKKFRPEDILGGEVNAAQESAKQQGFNPAVMKNLSFFDTFAYSLSGTEASKDDPKKALDPSSTREGYLATEKKFKLARKKMAGVEQIEDFDPSKDHAEALTEARMGNSNTYRDLKANNPEQYEQKKGEFSEAAEMAREGAVRLKDSEEDIGFGEMYSLFSGLNATVRKGDEGGGKLRGKFVTAGDINSVGSGQLPEDVFRTFSTIAAQMNEIKKTKDRDLQKTQAIQLAAFAYQMTLSEHMFTDGNGRTCRLFSDAILQSFGLPPHVPQESERSIAQTMGPTSKGKTMDFNAGAQSFLEGVQASDRTIKENAPAPAPAPAAPQTKGEKTSEQNFGYLNTEVPEDFDPAELSYDQQLAILYKKIKNPDPGDDEETISRRKRMFAETRAQQMKEQERAQTPAPEPGKEKSKKKWWQFWKK